MSEETSIDDLDPPYLSVKETMCSMEGFARIQKGLENHLAEFTEKMTAEKAESDAAKAEKLPVPQFDVFLRTTYGQFSRGFPHSASKLGASLKKDMMSCTQNRLEYQRNGLKNEFRSLKVFTTVDWNNQDGQLKRDIASLHKETPGYFGKPKIDGSNIPEVMKNKKNMMFVLRSIKQSEEQREQKRNEHREKLRAETKH